MSATNRGCERKAYDFYATPPETVRAFLANFDGISSGDRILEPSAGNGQIVKVLREGGYDNRIDAVELRPEERGTLEALADNVTIGSFFDYEPDCGYDVITDLTAVTEAMKEFQRTSQNAFNEWFATVQGLLDEDVAGRLINKTSDLDERLTALEYMIIHNDLFTHVVDDDGNPILDDDGNAIIGDWKYKTA